MTREIDSWEQLADYLFYEANGYVCVGVWSDSDVSRHCTDEFEQTLRDAVN